MDQSPKIVGIPQIKYYLSDVNTNFEEKNVHSAKTIRMKNRFKEMTGKLNLGIKRAKLFE